MTVAEALLALLVFGLIIGFMPVAKASHPVIEARITGTEGLRFDLTLVWSRGVFGLGEYYVPTTVSVFSGYPSDTKYRVIATKMERLGTLTLQITEDGVVVASQTTTADYGAVWIDYFYPPISPHKVEPEEPTVSPPTLPPPILPPTLPSIPPVEYVEFIAISLEIVPSQVIVGDEVEIIVNARNIGNIEGTDTLRLYLNNVQMQPENGEHLTLAPGENGVVIFAVTPLFTGSIDVKIGGQYGNFTVIAPPQEPTPTPTTEPLIGLGVTGGIIAAAVIISVAVSYVNRRRFVKKRYVKRRHVKRRR